jgi:hypothetical protein
MESKRQARTQVVFRAGNEALGKAAGPGDGLVPYICECADELCFARVPLARDEYEAVRAHPARFVVARGHEGGERTVAAYDGHAVIEKDDLAGEIARATDPRRAEGP